MTLDNKTMECACGGTANEIYTGFKGHKVRGWKCKKCSEVFLDPRDIQPILKMNKMKKENKLKTKLSYIGNSYTIRVPKPIIDSYGWKRGDDIEFVPEKDGFIIRDKNREEK